MSLKILSSVNFKNTGKRRSCEARRPKPSIPSSRPKTDTLFVQSPRNTRGWREDPEVEIEAAEFVAVIEGPVSV